MFWHARGLRDIMTQTILLIKEKAEKLNPYLCDTMLSDSAWFCLVWNVYSAAHLDFKK